MVSKNFRNTYGIQDLRKLDINKINTSLKSDIITNGTNCKSLEKLICKKTGSKYSVVCNNGTSAIMMALIALKTKKKIHIIIPNINFVASANIASIIGANIILCDVNSNTGMLDIPALKKVIKKCKEKKITPDFLMPIHYAGDVLDIKNISIFCEKRKMWYRVEPNGEILSLDSTFNHQLWFAMSGFLIIKAQQNKEIENRCLRFFNVISENLKLSNNGRIGQTVKLGFKEDVIKYNLKRIVRKNELQYIKLKEIGYHAFNTYAFSIIYDLYPNLKFFKTNDYRKIINYINSSEYKNNIYISNYGFKYNPPGFEVLKTYNTHESILNNSVEFIDGLLNFHLENNYDNMKCSFTRNVHDKNTSAARIYELSSSF